MASGLLKAGVDLDTLFMARVNAKRADVGIRVAGVDISNRYEAIGSGTPIAATGFKSAGVDLATYFRNISEGLGTHSLVAGQWAATPGPFIGYDSGMSVGLITPNTFLGGTIASLEDTYRNSPPDPPTNGLMFVMNVGPLLQTAFTSIQVNGHTFNTSVGVTSFFSFDGYTSWIWGNANFAGLVNGNTYPVTLT